MLLLFYSRVPMYYIYSECKDTICFSKMLCILYHELWKLYFFARI